MAQFLTVPQKPCLPKLTKTEEFLPASTLLSTPSVEQEEEPRAEDVPLQAPIVQLEQPAPTATLSADLLFDMVNVYRNEVNLDSLQKDPLVCSVAQSRKEEMVQEIFVTGNLHAGFYAKNLQYWATENLIWQYTEAKALSWWLNSPIHRSAIEGNYKYACGVCNGKICSMVFTNYSPRIVLSSATIAASQTSSTPPTVLR